MNAAQRRKARRTGPQPGDLVEWRDMRIGWLTGEVLSRLFVPLYWRRVRELDGRFHYLRGDRLRVLS